MGYALSARLITRYTAPAHLCAQKNDHAFCLKIQKGYGNGQAAVEIQLKGRIDEQSDTPQN